MKKSRIVYTLAILITAGLLFSCSESNLGTGSNSDQIATGNIHEVAAKKSHGDSPQQVFSEFQEMVKKVESMSKAEIDSLSDEEILELGEPIIKAFENTVKFDPETLNRLSEATRVVNEHPESITKRIHSETTKEVENILSSSISKFEKRTYDEKNIRDLLANMTATRGGVEDFFECDEYYNVQGNTVYLYYDDNFNLANYICPAGSTFNIMMGTHYGQTIGGSKNGNTWTGLNATLDGGGSTKRAFKDGMDNNSISWLTIRNYSRHGIVSDGSDNVALGFLTFKNIAPSYCQGVCGQNEGAIMFTDSGAIYVLNSEFENVASGIRFRDSDGPLVVKDNEALNSGRNFFQCDNCNGGHIRINDNSMEHTAAYGNAVLEDWINIYDSEGTSSSWIEVKHNRARGHGGSPSGSMIILGDLKGRYQKAIDNIGVNPGQVGIGAAGGHDILVEGNLMYSEEWNHSNVAFYSQNIYTTQSCGNHDFPYETNKADWICGDSGDCTPPYYNRAHSDNQCGILHSTIWNNVEEDKNMGPGIWNSW